MSITIDKFVLLHYKVENLAPNMIMTKSCQVCVKSSLNLKLKFCTLIL